MNKPSSRNRLLVTAAAALLVVQVGAAAAQSPLERKRQERAEARQERAAANKISETELEAFYRDRSMLKRSVYPEDIAEATYFFAADHLSAKSTGNILNVDAGNLAAFTR